MSHQYYQYYQYYQLMSNTDKSPPYMNKCGLMYDSRYKLIHFAALSIHNTDSVLTKIDTIQLPTELSKYFICRDVHSLGHLCHKCTIVNAMRYSKIMNGLWYKSACLYNSVMTDNLAFIESMNKHQICDTEMTISIAFPTHSFFSTESIIRCAVYYNSNTIVSHLLNNLNLQLDPASIFLALLSNNIFVLEYCYTSRINIWYYLDSINRTRAINCVTDIRALRILSRTIDINKFDIHSLTIVYKNFTAFKYVYDNGYKTRLHNRINDLTLISICEDYRFIEYLVDNGFLTTIHEGYVDNVKHYCKNVPDRVLRKLENLCK